MGQLQGRYLGNASRDFNNRNEYGNFEANLRFLREIDLLNKGMKILEIGTGKGALLSYLYRDGYNIKGIEINQSMINESKRLYGTLPLDKVDGDGLLPYEDGSFDVVLGFDVFEHIPNSVKHLREVRRVLNTGGHYLLQTPNKWTNVIFETIRWRSVTKWRPDHCSLHNHWQIRRRFEKNGFEMVFYKIPVVTPFFKRKIETYLGKFGLLALRIIDPDKLPVPLRPNFHIKARKTT